MFTSAGGGGNSLKSPTSLPLSSTFILPALTDADTHLKNALIVALSALSKETTQSVICFKVSVFAY